MSTPERPAYFDNLIRAVREDDAAWFRTHPGKTVRYREMIPGEFWPDEPEPPPVGSWTPMVQVDLLDKGVRHRGVYWAEATRP